jgi:hypothetical protein
MQNDFTQILELHRQRMFLESVGEIDSPQYAELFDTEERLLTSLVQNSSSISAPPGQRFS